MSQIQHILDVKISLEMGCMKIFPQDCNLQLLQVGRYHSRVEVVTTKMDSRKKVVHSPKFFLKIVERNKNRDNYVENFLCTVHWFKYWFHSYSACKLASSNYETIRTTFF